MVDQQIPCPACGFEVPIAARDMLAGKETSCPTCKKKVGLRESARGMAGNTKARLDGLRNIASER